MMLTAQTGNSGILIFCEMPVAKSVTITNIPKGIIVGQVHGYEKIERSSKQRAGHFNECHYQV